MIGIKELKVLIIDDAYFFRALLKKNIEQKPITNDTTFTVIEEAKSGKDGIAKYFDTLPDLVTLDYNMPDLNGIDTAKEILSKAPNAKIIVISNSLNKKETIKQKFLDLGILACINKPICETTLWDKLDEIFKLKSEEKQITKLDEEDIIVYKEDDIISDDYSNECKICNDNNYNIEISKETKQSNLENRESDNIQSENSSDYVVNATNIENEKTSDLVTTNGKQSKKNNFEDTDCINTEEINDLNNFDIYTPIEFEDAFIEEPILDTSNTSNQINKEEMNDSVDIVNSLDKATNLDNNNVSDDIEKNIPNTILKNDYDGYIDKPKEETYKFVNNNIRPPRFNKNNNYGSNLTYETQKNNNSESTQKKQGLLEKLKKIFHK